MSDFFLGIFFIAALISGAFIDVNSWIPSVALLVSFIGLGVTAYIKNKE